MDAKPVTKDYLDTRLNGVVQTLRGDIRDAMRHVSQRLDRQDEKIEKVETKLVGIETTLVDVADDITKIKLAVLDYLGTDRAVHNLVRELKSQGIKLDERKIFAS